jgi:hypothetical protein
MNENARSERTMSDRRRPTRIALGVAAVCFMGLTLAVAAAETTLRLLDYPKEQPVGWAWRGDPRESNELGFRGHRAPEKVDDIIMLVGDSQVETLRPFALMPEVLLSAALRELSDRDTRVVSVAAAGWGQDQQLLALRRAVTVIRPRMVVLWLSPGNDLWNNTFPTHMPKDGWPKPTFWLEGDTLRGPHAAWGEAYRPPGPRLFRAWRHILRRPMYVTDAEWESKLPPAYSGGSVQPGRVRSLVEFAAAQYQVSVPEMAAALAHENFENEKTHASIALTPRSPRLQYSIRLTRALLREIAQLCRQQGATFLVFHIDTRPYANLPEEPTPFEVSGRLVTLSNAAEQAAVIREVLGDVPSLVLSGYRPHFRTSKLDAHLNDEGNHYFMRELARRLDELLTGAGRAG